MILWSEEWSYIIRIIKFLQTFLFRFPVFSFRIRTSIPVQWPMAGINFVSSEKMISTAI